LEEKKLADTYEAVQETARAFVKSSQKLLKEEIPYILNQVARAGFIIYFGDRETKLVTKLITSLAVYSYDVITNNVDTLKNHKYIPNYWA
jgi:hypothetical protein